MRPEVRGVRQRVRVRERASRSLDQRIFVRSRRLAKLALGFVVRLPPESALRRRLMNRAVRLAVEALNRGDHEATLAFWGDDVIATPPPEFTGLGFSATSRGREARMRLQREWEAHWGEHRQEVDAVIDCGDTVVILARVIATGASSGAAFDHELSYVLNQDRWGLIGRERVFLSHREGLEAAGVPA